MASKTKLRLSAVERQREQKRLSGTRRTEAKERPAWKRKRVCTVQRSERVRKRESVRTAEREREREREGEGECGALHCIAVRERDITALP